MHKIDFQVSIVTNNPVKEIYLIHLIYLIFKIRIKKFKVEKIDMPAEKVRLRLKKIKN